MRLSSAIQSGQQFAANQVFHGGYWSFDPDYSLASSKIGADCLFSAYLGRAQGKGLLDVIRALKSPERPVEGACWLVLDTLMRNWRYLGESAENLGAVAFVSHGGPAPEKGESLWFYLVRLNDEERWARGKVAALLREVGL